MILQSEPYLRRNDFDRCHKAVRNNGHSHENVHEAEEVDDGSPCPLPLRRVEWQPHWQQYARFTHYSAGTSPFVSSCDVRGLGLVRAWWSFNNRRPEGGGRIGKEKNQEKVNEDCWNPEGYWSHISNGSLRSRWVRRLCCKTRKNQVNLRRKKKFMKITHF